MKRHNELVHNAKLLIPAALTMYVVRTAYCSLENNVLKTNISTYKLFNIVNLLKILGATSK